MTPVIKFRAWDLRNNTWMHGYKTMGGFHLFGETIVLGGWLTGVSLKDWDNIVVQQFIGLTDKNGKEIYEGDILSIDDDSPEKTEGNAIVVVKRKGAGWGYDEDGNFEYITNFLGEDTSDGYATVVGNIFENEDLLNR